MSTEIPYLNHVLDFDLDRAKEEWVRGVDPEDPEIFLDDNVAISQDRRWLIRRPNLLSLTNSVDTSIDLEELCQATSSELERLHYNNDIDILSRKLCPDTQADQVYVVTRYIPGLHNRILELDSYTNRMFVDQVAPGLKNYAWDFVHRSANPHIQPTYCLENIYEQFNYAFTHLSRKLVLHNVMPHIHNKTKTATLEAMRLGQLITYHSVESNVH
jgi:hypothetical protein